MSLGDVTSWPMSGFHMNKRSRQYVLSTSSVGALSCFSLTFLSLSQSFLPALLLLPSPLFLALLLLLLFPCSPPPTNTTMFPHLPSDQPAVDSRLFALPSSPSSAQLALVWLLSTRTNHEFDRGKEKTSP
jgi:hypothetical protein